MLPTSFEDQTPIERFDEDLKKKSANTQRQYRRYFEQFLRDREVSANDFYDYCKKVSDNKNPNEIRALDNWLNQYFESLLTSGSFKLSTIRIMEAAIHLFLSANTIQLSLWFDVPTEVKKENIEAIQQEGKDKAEVSEIKRLLEVCGNPRNSAIILTLRDSGLRASDVGNLQIKHIKPILDNPEIEFYTFELIPEKNLGKDRPLPANPVLGYESLNAIRFWVQKRTKLYMENGLAPNDLNGWLFPSLINREGVTKVGDKIDGNAINQLFHKLREKAELEKPVSPHSLRKTHNTNLLGASVPERWLNVMLGKEGEGTQGTYQKPNTTQLIGVYKDAYHAISLEGTPMSAELEKIKAELAEIKRQLQEELKRD